MKTVNDVILAAAGGVQDPHDIARLLPVVVKAGTHEALLSECVARDLDDVFNAIEDFQPIPPEAREVQVFFHGVVCTHCGEPSVTVLITDGADRVLATYFADLG